MEGKGKEEVGRGGHMERERVEREKEDYGIAREKDDRRKKV